MKPPLLILGTTLVLSGCGSNTSQGVDPFSEGAKAVYFTSKCSAKVDGQCQQWTCTSDGDQSGPGNCSGFAKGCLKENHHYSGTAEEGKCTRTL
jgi:hypothetical protein